MTSTNINLKMNISLVNLMLLIFVKKELVLPVEQTGGLDNF